MTPRQRRLRRFPRWRRRADDAGFVAVMVAIMLPVLFGLASFSVDVANWYSTVQKVQRAADAAALAGVTYMPSNLTGAKTQALATAAANGFSNSTTTTVDPEPVSGQPSQFKVTITTIVTNTFLQLFGDDTTTITRSAVANYQAPLPMGSPCNGFGNGPEPTIGASNPRSSNCSASGQFWANVGAPKSLKSYGDAYQDDNCPSGNSDNCSGGTNQDYQSAGYFYSIKLSQAVTNLTIQAFDPAFVSVGDTCTDASFGSSYTAASYAKNQYNYNVGTSTGTASYREDSALYANGAASSYCTGDQIYATTGTPPDTTFTIRQPSASSNPWDPTSYPVVASCTKTFTGVQVSSLYTALNQYQQTNGVVQYAGGAPKLATTGSSGYQGTVASEFRQWVTLCTFSGTVSAGTYFVQVQTDASADTTSGDGHNRFALRAYGSTSTQNAAIAISGYTYMGIYANLPSAQTTFYLTQVPPSAAGQILQLRLFDIGDSSGSGTITVNPPSDSNQSAFSSCTGSGVTSGNLTNCAIPANSNYNGKWQTINVPIPKGYTCNSSASTGCWVTLTYNYGSGNQPSDTTSWTASLEGTPVRITQ